MPQDGPTLNDLRGEIDRLDDALVDLLIARARVAAAIAPLKAEAGAPPLRPGREVEVLRRLTARAGAALDPLVVARIWREVMSAALRLQGAFSVAVSAPEGGPSCWGLARIQYGVGTPMTAAPGPAQAIAEVARGAAQVAVVPFPVVDEPDPWWTRLMTAGRDAPRIIAHLPVAEGLAPQDGCARGLVAAAMAPEPSGQDRSLIAVESDGPVSRAHLTQCFAKAGLTVRFATATADGAGMRHLAEVDGFIAETAPALAGVAAALGIEAGRVAVIGAYGAPLDFSASRHGS